MNSNVLRAVFTRNFISYFTNPTGYVFICLFVLLSSWRAFWPDEFFISNLANLDQLNKVFPWIMLVFIPAITMSVWAEERREGTDELLLTVPSTDLDIVLGKYLAAVAIYTVSLLFSFAASLIVLRTLGNPDVGLFTSTYLGYWLVGLAMLSIGMVASFVTSNLTVAYVFGAVFNLPLIFAYYINKTRLEIFDFGQAASEAQNWTLTLTTRPWSIQQQLSDFARGVPTFSGIVYFAAIVVVMLYLSMILMGRRHWSSSSTAFTTGMNYLIRVVSLSVIMMGLFTISQRAGLHWDMTSEQLTSLSPHTIDLLDKLDTNERPVRIDAFISPEVPEAYVQTRLNLINTLKEMQAVGGKKLDVVIHETKRFGDEATLADERFRITARKVTTEERGAFADDFIFMGVAFRCGLSPVTIPFFDRGTPIEYELIRSICTVAQQKRKTVGVLTTDAQLYGQFNMQTMQPGRNWAIIDELEKQYEVVRIDPKQPIDTKKIDVLLTVQPSSLGPPEMDNFIAAIKQGMPTAIFEDPAPLLTPGIPPTSAPRQSNNRMAMMMGRQQQSPPKGDIKKLWNLLGVTFSPDTIVWQKYNPYPKFSQFPDEFVFVDEGAGVDEPFNVEEPVSSGLQQVLFPFPGSISKIGTEKVLKITPLAVTADKATGTIPLQMIRQGIRTPTNETYVLAARIRGEIETTVPQDKPADGKTDDEKAKEGEEPQETKTVKSTINVVLAADVDMLSPAFFEIREKGNMPEMGIHFEFDNVTFVLNVLDELAGNSDFLEIRKRRRVHRTLTRIQERTEAAREASTKAIEDEREEFKQARAEVEKGLTDEIQKLQKEMNDKHVDIQEIVRRVGIVQRDGQKRMDAKIEQMELKRDKKILRIDEQLSNEIEEVQNSYRMWAVLLPPIPPLVLACFVFFIRRAREREGVSQTRLR